ncbi:MAG: hypothetical protein ABIO70_36120 [Pseudomonadota bacterium]
MSLLLPPLPTAPLPEHRGGGRPQGGGATADAKVGACFAGLLPLEAAPCLAPAPDPATAPTLEDEPADASLAIAPWLPLGDAFPQVPATLDPLPGMPPAAPAPLPEEPGATAPPRPAAAPTPPPSPAASSQASSNPAVYPRPEPAPPQHLGSTSPQESAAPPAVEDAGHPPSERGAAPSTRTPRAEVGPPAAASASPRGLASVPEPMLFTVEFDAQAAVAATRAAQTPGPAAPHAASPPPPLAALALPREVELLLQDPDGPVKLTVGRDQREVSVRVEVPHGLLPAIEEAHQPVRAALAQRGFELGRYDVHGGQQGAGGDGRGARREPGEQRPARGAHPPREATSGTAGRATHRGLLDRRA